MTERNERVEGRFCETCGVYSVTSSHEGAVCPGYSVHSVERHNPYSQWEVRSRGGAGWSAVGLYPTRGEAVAEAQSRATKVRTEAKAESDRRFAEFVRRQERGE
jgi:hypothetical protein